MDLIYTDHNFVELGVLKKFKLDLDVAGDKDCALQLPLKANVLQTGYYWYIDGTEYGGVLDSVKVSTAEREITYSGRNWRGLLASKIIEPPAGSDYRIVSGTLNSVTAALLSTYGLNSLFSVAADSTTVTSFQFDRYITLYDGLIKLAAAHGKVLRLSYAEGTVTISFGDPHDYTDLIEYTSDDRINFVAERNTAGINHLICLGKGDLALREVVHLYADANGLISTTQTLTGLDEVTATYDYTNAESSAELLASGTKKLQELIAGSSFEVDVQDVDLLIGDVVGGSESITGITGSAAISNIIVKIQNGVLTREYKIG